MQSRRNRTALPKSGYIKRLVCVRYLLSTEVAPEPGCLAHFALSASVTSDKAHLRIIA